MKQQTIEKLVKSLCGLKRYEWNRVSAAVERVYDSASNKLELDDTESLTRFMELELNGKITL